MFYLQFTGTKSRYYTPETFVKEALKQGFGRVVPFPIVFGATMAFATFIADKNKPEGSPRRGDAHIFAVGTITSWHVQAKTAAASRFWHWFHERLRQMGIITKVNGGSTLIRRRCGHYEVHSHSSVSEGKEYELLAELHRALDEWNQTHPDARVSIRDFRWIMIGSLIWYANGHRPPLVLTDVPFTRGVLIVRTDLPLHRLPTDPLSTEWTVATVKNYALADELSHDYPTLSPLLSLAST